MRFDVKPSPSGSPGLDQSALVTLLQKSQVDALELASHTLRVQGFLMSQKIYGFKKLFDHLHNTLITRADELAVRAVAHGGPALRVVSTPGQTRGWEANAMGSLGDLTRHSPELDGRHLVDSLVVHFGEFTDQMHDAISTTRRLSHPESSAFYTGLAHAMERATWMLTAFLDTSTIARIHPHPRLQGEQVASY